MKGGLLSFLGDQTIEGAPIEELEAVRPQLLEGEAQEGVWDALVEAARDAGFEVIRDRKGTENGYCDLGNKVIAVRPAVTPAQALKTLVHELAHALLHGDGVARGRELQEVEVESVAYVVCGALGLDTGDYSFAYVARWSGATPRWSKRPPSESSTVPDTSSAAYSWGPRPSPADNS